MSMHRYSVASYRYEGSHRATRRPGVLARLTLTVVLAVTFLKV